MPHTILYKCRLCWISSFVVVVFVCCYCFVVVVLLLLTTFGNFRLLLAPFGCFWQLLATFGNFWQLLATFGNFWKLLETSWSCWNRCSNASLRQSLTSSFNIKKYKRVMFIIFNNMIHTYLWHFANWSISPKTRILVLIKYILDLKDYLFVSLCLFSRDSDVYWTGQSSFCRVLK